MSLFSFLAPGSFTRALAGGLILTLMSQPPAILLAEPSLGRHSKGTPATKPLTEEERATHALNRLTFGPRPGDLERVQAIGVKKWIELQLNPGQIDDSLLEARLQSFPAMHRSQQDLLQTFPSNAVIRAVAEGKVPPACGPGGARHLPKPGRRLRREAAEAGTGGGRETGGRARCGQPKDDPTQ